MFWGPTSQVGVLKSRALDVQSKPFPPQGEGGSWGFPPNCVLLVLGVGFMARVCLSLSHSLRCEYFFICQICGSHSVCAWISFRGNCSIYSHIFVMSIGEMELRRLLNYYLGQLLISVI